MPSVMDTMVEMPASTASASGTARNARSGWAMHRQPGHRDELEEMKPFADSLFRPEPLDGYEIQMSIPSKVSEDRRVSDRMVILQKLC